MERIYPPNAVGQRVRAGSYTGTVVAIDGGYCMVALDRLHVTQQFDRCDLRLIGAANK